MRIASPTSFFQARCCLVILAVLALMACGGDGTGPGGNDLFMRLRVNGTLYEYSLPSGLVATQSTTTTQSNAAFTGNDGGATYTLLQVWDVNAIGVDTYSGLTITTGLVGAIISFQDAAGNDYVSGDTPAEATVVVTEYSATHVAGTFFGVLHETGLPDLAVTEGSFRVARVN